MSLSTRTLLVAAAVTVTLAACQRRDEKPAAPPATPDKAPATAAANTTPTAYDSKNQYAKVKLALPAGVTDKPELQGPLYADAVRELNQFSEGAQADLSEAGAGPNPYEKSITYSQGGESAKLFSLARTNFEYTGGAHPNQTYASVIWDKGLKKRIGVNDLFRPGADLSILDKALCDAANAAKQARSPGSERVSVGGKGMWSCPKASATPFVLTPGSTPGKIGGITFLFDSYQIGPHSDGDYWLAVPQAAFRSLLAPAYADEFAGAPVKAGDVTPRN
nr:DUF3298 domain-containing protein [uncultured Brevundimonas sp.]